MTRALGGAVWKLRAETAWVASGGRRCLQCRLMQCPPELLQLLHEPAPHCYCCYCCFCSRDCCCCRCCGPRHAPHLHIVYAWRQACPLHGMHAQLHQGYPRRLPCRWLHSRSARSRWMECGRACRAEDSMMRSRLRRHACLPAAGIPRACACRHVSGSLSLSDAVFAGRSSRAG